MRPHFYILLGSSALALALGVAAACDPVHSEQMAALGDEAAGVETGPLHRPGQPCTVCHDGKLGSPTEFSVAGTVFRNQDDSIPVDNARVNLTDANGVTYSAATNAAGNFYVSPNQFSPAYPMKTEIVVGQLTIPMISEIGRAGACSGCHVAPVSPNSPGNVFVPADGGPP